jgi:lactate permease
VAPIKHPTAAVVKAWTPWVILTVFVFVWGLPVTKAWLNGLFAPSSPMTACTS